MEEGLIHGVKLSSVGPANVTGPDAVTEPHNIDLAMKLHYLRGIYFFGSGLAFAGFTILSVKEPLFTWLDQFPVPCGRFRRRDSGRPYIKCNDCGARLIQANSHKTLHEWLHMNNHDYDTLLCANHFIGPELQFSPLVYLQITNFKCGGVAVGLSWAHVLGDAFSAAKFINMLGRAVSGFKPDRPINLPQTLNRPSNPRGLPKSGSDPLSVKRVDPVGDNWVHAAPCKMDTFSFDVKISHLRSKLGGDFPPFEALAAVIWQCVARVRAEARVVNVFRRSEENSGNGTLGNTQIVSVAKADFAVAEANPSELVRLLRDEASDDRRMIDEVVERDGGLSDFIVYGANLSFVNLEEATFYDFECNGQKPVRVVYRVDGVGEKGAVLVLPGVVEGGGGRLVTVMLPENEVAGVKSELKREGVMA
ncbi:protein ECERIFERUM 26-like [Salvia miltiorrhiza]|uniref:protein ECERIFERUM 26-like n=1 Tax=Salvia miltiorrhiza TaxID=226208 RepID=UPI0025AC38D7|nr:protein ECERIFERUM 26-like [Salvia miltiorrhiza]